uniref:B-cell receptor CD22 first Ig-like domain-containing protein n=1 Tax=Terrapene triunguis TaxID=2587831 RepID=A0A674JWP7_9SAUR
MHQRQLHTDSQPPTQCEGLLGLPWIDRFLCHCDQPIEVPMSLIIWTGACLSIPCRYQSCLLNPRRPNKPTINSLAWCLNPGYDHEKIDFSGTVLYKHSASICPAVAGCVGFLGDLERDCSLQLSDLRASENGSYGLRPIASNPRQKQEEEKWMTRISVNVMGKRESPGVGACMRTSKLNYQLSSGPLPPFPTLGSFWKPLTNSW